MAAAAIDGDHARCHYDAVLACVIVGCMNADRALGAHANTEVCLAIYAHVAGSGSDSYTVLLTNLSRGRMSKHDCFIGVIPFSHVMPHP